MCSSQNIQGTHPENHLKAMRFLVLIHIVLVEISSMGYVAWERKEKFHEASRDSAATAAEKNLCFPNFLLVTCSSCSNK